MTQPPNRTPIDDETASGGRGLAARVSLGTLFRPLPLEYWLILSSSLLLTVFGLVMVLSATSASPDPFGTVLRQAIFVAIGVPAMLIISRFPRDFLMKMAWPALIGSILMQALVFSPLGIEDGGNRNWVRVFGMQLQPSEFMKLTLALVIGWIMYRKRAVLGTLMHDLIPMIPVALVVLGLVMLGKDLGTASVIVLVLLGCILFSPLRFRVFVIVGLGSAAGAFVAAAMSSNRMARILSFLDPHCLDDYLTTCWQPLHAIWGLAGGGVWGVGLGNSREKYSWLPAAANDYIFAIVGEELGLIGCIVVLALFAMYTVGVLRIIRRTNDPFVRTVTGGLLFWMIGQALTNIGVVLRLAPALGVPLPFMSQGGTSLLAGLFATGVLLSFAARLPVDGDSQSSRGKIVK